MTNGSVPALRRGVALACAAALLAGCSKVSTDASPSTAPSGAASDVAAVSAAASATSGGNGFTKPHQLRVALQGDVSTLNPLLDSQLQMYFMADLTLAWLVRFDRSNKPIPELALAVPSKANGLISADGKTVTYHLQRNAKWSDGQPFTADDVVFSVGVINDPKTNVPSRTGWDQIAKIDEPDKYTVVFHFKKPYSPFVATAFASGGGSPAILPKHVLAHTANINTDPYNALPLGIGPFKYTKWARGDEVEMVANPLYFRGSPKLTKITFKIIPNRDTIVNELATGDLDLWPVAARAYYPRLVTLKGFHVLRQPSYGFGHLDFNTKHATVSDPVVRKALELAYDRREALVKIGHGIGTLQDSVVSPNDPYFDPHIGFTAFDLAKANAILDAGGWKRGADGIRAKNGVRLDLDFASNAGSPDTDNLVELLRQNWAQIGVTFTRKNYAINQLLASAQEGGIIQTGKFDAVIFAWFPTGADDLSQSYGCGSFPPNGQNDLFWCDARASAAMDDFNTTFDVARKTHDQWILQEELVKETPTIVQAVYNDLFVENDDLQNFHPNNVSMFDDFMNVDI